MTHASLLSGDWRGVGERLGGSELLDGTARESRAFVRSREIKTAVDLLRLLLAYCLGPSGLRLTAAWAAASGLANVSNVALLQRPRQRGGWGVVVVARCLWRAGP